MEQTNVNRASIHLHTPLSDERITIGTMAPIDMVTFYSKNHSQLFRSK